MTKSFSSLLVIFISSLVAIIQVTTNGEFVRPVVKEYQAHWLANSHPTRNNLLKKWFDNRKLQPTVGSHLKSSPFDILHPTNKFPGCIDPSEPFQCPQSERCISLQFICDQHPGDCPGNLDENEETCIAAKRPAKENIEKFLDAEYTLHGPALFTFLFGKKLSRSIEENRRFWFDTLASAFSVAKNLRSFAEKTHMSPDELQHFKQVLQMIYDGRLEDIPLYVQEAVHQGFSSIIEKLYESGFMEQ